MSTQLEQLLTTRARGRVRFVLVGGAAAIAHGSARLTLDVDIVYGRDGDTLQRLVETLGPLTPYPPGLPFDRIPLRRVSRPGP